MDEYLNKLMLTHHGRNNIFVTLIFPDDGVAIKFMNACENDDEFFEYYVVERRIVLWKPNIFLKNSFMRLSTKLFEQFITLRLVMLRYFNKFAGYNIEVMCNLSKHIFKQDYFICEFVPVFENMSFTIVVNEHKDIVMKFLSDLKFAEVYPEFFKTKISRN